MGVYDHYGVNDIGRCDVCGGPIISTSGMPHTCRAPRWPIPPNYPYQPLGPLNPPGVPGISPMITEERIREIVREELERHLSEVSPSTEAPSEEK